MSTIVIRVEGVDITNDVILEAATFTTSIGAFPGDFDIRVKDPTIAYDFKASDNITLDIDGDRSFDGYVMMASKQFAFPVVDTSEPQVLMWHLTGVDINILFSKRFVYKVADPKSRIADFPVGTTDLTALNKLFDEWLDLTGDSITDDFTQVGIITPDEKGLPFTLGDTWAQAMANISQLPGAVWGIRPDRTFFYEDDDTESAPFRLSDTPNNTTSFGYSDMEWLHDGTKLVNDSLFWGAGLGSSELVYSRVQDDASIATHGRWQTGQLRGDIYRQTSADLISTSIVYGSPQNLHGGKDDAEVVTCRIRQPGLVAGDKVHITSNVFGVSKILPIRRMTVTFPNPEAVLYDLNLSYEIDRPLSFHNFPKFPKFGDIKITDPWIPGTNDPCECGITDTFSRTYSGGIGTSDAGLLWSAGSTVSVGGGRLTLPSFGNQGTGSLDPLRPSNEIGGYLEFSADDISEYSYPPGSTQQSTTRRFGIFVRQATSSFSSNETQILFTLFATGIGGVIGLWRYNFDSTTGSDNEWAEQLYGFATGTTYKVRWLCDRAHSYMKIWVGDTEPSNWTLVSNTNFENGVNSPSPLPIGSDDPDGNDGLFRENSYGISYTASVIYNLSGFQFTQATGNVFVDNVEVELDGQMIDICSESYFDSFNRQHSGSWGTSDSGAPWTGTVTGVSRFTGGVLEHGGVNSAKNAETHIPAAAGLPLLDVTVDLSWEDGGFTPLGSNGIWASILFGDAGEMYLGVLQDGTSGWYLTDGPNSTAIQLQDWGWRTWYRIRIQADDTEWRAKVWNAMTTEPSTWVTFTPAFTNGDQTRLRLGLEAVSNNGDRTGIIWDRLRLTYDGAPCYQTDTVIDNFDRADHANTYTDDDIQDIATWGTPTRGSPDWIGELALFGGLAVADPTASFRLLNGLASILLTSPLPNDTNQSPIVNAYTTLDLSEYDASEFSIEFEIVFTPNLPSPAAGTNGFARADFSAGVGCKDTFGNDVNLAAVSASWVKNWTGGSVTTQPTTLLGLARSGSTTISTSLSTSGLSRRRVTVDRSVDRGTTLISVDGFNVASLSTSGSVNLPIFFFVQLQTNYNDPATSFQSILSIDNIVAQNTGAEIAISDLPIQPGAGSFGCESPEQVSAHIYETSYEYLGGSLDVYVDGVRQRLGVDYFESGAQQFYLATPGDSVYCCYLAYGLT